MAGYNLTIPLDNTSPRGSTDAADVLTSFYFDILNGTSRPTLTYTGVSGYTEANIVDKVVFGLGTTPDASFTVSVPEPGTCALLATVAAALVAWRSRRGNRPQVLSLQHGGVSGGRVAGKTAISNRQTTHGAS